MFFFSVTEELNVYHLFCEAVFNFNRHRRFFRYGIQKWQEKMREIYTQMNGDFVCHKTELIWRYYQKANS